jgi:hypothetical protein
MPGFLYSDDEEGAEISKCQKAEGLLKRSVERRSTGEDTIMFKNCCFKDDKGVDVIICQSTKSIPEASSREVYCLSIPYYEQVPVYPRGREKQI